MYQIFQINCFINDNCLMKFIDGNGNDGNLEFNLNKFKPDYVGSKKLKIQDQKEKILNLQQENRRKKLQQRKKKKIKKIICQIIINVEAYFSKRQKLDEIVKKINNPIISCLIKIIFDYSLSQIHNENNSQL